MKYFLAIVLFIMTSSASLAEYIHGNEDSQNEPENITSDNGLNLTIRGVLNRGGFSGSIFNEDELFEYVPNVEVGMPASDNGRFRLSAYNFNPAYGAVASNFVHWRAKGFLSFPENGNAILTYRSDGQNAYCVSAVELNGSVIVSYGTGEEPYPFWEDYSYNVSLSNVSTDDRYSFVADFVCMGSYRNQWWPLLQNQHHDNRFVLDVFYPASATTYRLTTENLWLNDGDASSNAESPAESVVEQVTE